jgi:hypothetical protein
LTHAIIGNVTSAVNFNNHLLSNVNLESLSIQGVAVTASAEELNKLSALSGSLTGSELNYLDLAASEPGTSEPNKVVTADADGHVTLSGDLTVMNNLFIDSGKLTIDGEVVETSAQELNVLNGVLGVTASDLNLLAGISTHLGESAANRVLTTDANQSVTVGGILTAVDMEVQAFYLNDAKVEATAEEINKLKGLNTTKDQLELLSSLHVGVDALNALNGLTASTEDLNLMEGLSTNRSNMEGGKPVVLAEDGTLSLNTVSIGTLNVSTLKLDGVEVLSTAEDLNVFAGIASSLEADNFKLLEGLTASADDLNRLSNLTSSKDDLEIVSGLALDKSNSQPGKAIVLDTDGTLHMHHDVRVTGTLNVDQLSINDTLVNVTALELNVLSGLQSSVHQLNSLSEVTLSPEEFSSAVNLLANISDVTANSINMLEGVYEDRSNAVSGRVVVSKDDGTVEIPEVVVGHMDVSGTLTVGGELVIASASDLNKIHDVVNLTKSDLEKLAAIEATAEEINTISSLDVHVDDLNLLSGLSALGSNNSVGDHLAILDADGNLNLANNLTADQVSFTTLIVNDAELTADISVLNQFVGIDSNLTSDDVNKLIGMPLSSELNVLSGVNTNLTSADLNLLVEMADSEGQSVASKAVVTDSDGNVQINGDVTVTGVLDANTLKIDGAEITASADSINTLSTLEAISVEKINEFNSITASATQLNKFESVSASAADLDALSSFSVNAEQVNSINSLTADASDLALLSNVNNFLALDTDNNVDVVDVTVEGTLTIGTTSITASDINKCGNFFEESTACSGGFYHILHNTDDSHIYLCKPDDSSILLS